ncbi:MAG: ribonuclease E/G [Lachnospiraceae bacterium]|nr:ribonuclease E/G [Lachnospiraceae bacterium]
MKEFVITDLTVNNRPLRVAAIFKDGSLSDIRLENRDKTSRVGEIVNGLVEKVDKGISGAFVRLGPTTRAFMPLRPDTKLRGSEKVPVVITKDAHANKQITCDERLSVTDALCVISEGKGRITYSKKLTGEEKMAIRAGLDPLAATFTISENGERHYDILVRTNAREVPEEALLEAVSRGRGVIEEVRRASKEKHVGTVLYQPETFYEVMLSEMSEMPDRTVTDIPLVHNTLAVCEFYEERGLTLAEKYDLPHEVDKLTRKAVWLKSGAYLVIEQTEAFVSIDINSGHCKKGKDAQAVYEAINCEAAEEIARQLRLRNLSGMILVDFIKMTSREAEERVLQTLKAALKADRVHAEAVDITRLGLGEVIREKRRSSVAEIIFG